MLRHFLFIVVFLFSIQPTLAQDELNVGIKLAPPFVMEDGSGGYTGISIELWDKIAADLGYTTNYKPVDLNTLLDGVENGTFDAGVGALTTTAKREAVMDFTHPFYTSGLGIAVTPAGNPLWLVLDRIFSVEFFFAVLALMVLLGTVGLVIWLCERRGNADEFGGSTAEGLGSGLWWAAVTMTTVGYGDKSPRTFAGRIVGLIWMFAAIILISGFTAAIATSLTVGSLESQVKTVDDLHNVKTATVSRSSSGEALQARSIAFSPVDTIETGLQELVQGNVTAVVYDAPLLKYLVNNEYPKRSAILPYQFESQEYAIALVQGSPLREDLNRKILEITNSAEWNDTVSKYLGEEE